MHTPILGRRLILAALLAGACGHGPTRPTEQTPQLYPDGPVLLATGRTVQILTYVGPSWETPSLQNGISCSSRDTSLVAVSSDCVALAGTKVGNTAVVVSRYGATAEVPISVVTYPYIRLPDPRPGIGSTSTAFVDLSPQGIGYVAGWNVLGETYLWRLDLNQQRADSALRVNGTAAGAAVFNAAGTVAYAAGFGGVVSVIDVASNSVTDTIQGLPGEVYTALLAPDDSTLYLGTDGHLTALDVRSHAVRADLPETGLLVLSLALDSVTNRLYATVYGGYRTGFVLELNAATLAVQRTVVTSDFGAKGLFLDRGAARLYVASESDQLLVCPLGGVPACTVVPEKFCAANDVTLNAAGTELYLGCGDVIRVIDPGTLQTLRFVVGYGINGAWKLKTRPGLAHTVDLSALDITLLP